MYPRTLHPLPALVRAQKGGCARGLCSVCSANRHALQAAMLQGLQDETCVCVEATSNQVNQFGGYSGMTPSDFARMVRSMARKLRLPSEALVLGGDHLGPNAWRKENSGSAMRKAADMVRAYALAGFSKIHLDASMPCADDRCDNEGRLPMPIVAARTAELCRAAEAARADFGRAAPPVFYVIGTEVPRPGGAQDALHQAEVTRPADAEHTIVATQRAFTALGLEAAWERVVAIVVQAGVEFGDSTVLDYDPRKTARLARLIERYDRLVYEAHSTDYQTASALKGMVQDHFAILKVGPELTFAFREAVFALDTIASEIPGRLRKRRTSLREALDRAMLDRPEHWRPYYHGTSEQQAFARKYSLSDRARYYWTQPEVKRALARLIACLSSRDIPFSLLSQYLPHQCQAVREGRIPPTPEALILDRIMEVTARYANACRP